MEPDITERSFIFLRRRYVCRQHSNGFYWKDGNSLKFSLKEKYGIEDEAILDKVLKIHGLSKENFDFVNNLEGLIEQGIVDLSIDQNSNKNETTVAGLMNETVAPLQKLIGYRFLYRKMKELYGKKEAKRLSGEMYDFSIALSDSTKIMSPYCWAMDASKLVIEGRPFGQLPSAPPKRLASYIAALNETVHQLSNHLAGAIAVGSFFLDAAHVLLIKEGLDIVAMMEQRKYVENCFQNFVHSVNHLSRNSSESPFSNISIFDRPKIRALIDDDNMGWYFEEQDKEYVVEYIMALQEIFMDFFDGGDKLNGGSPFRFPVVTLNITKNTDESGVINIEDTKFVDMVCHHEIYRYNIMVSAGSRVASCCFDGDQPIVARYCAGNPELTTMGELTGRKQKSDIRLPDGGGWRKATPIEIYRGDKKMYKVTTVNNKTLFMTEDHLNPTVDGDKRADRLSIDDYLMFNTTITHPVPEKDEGLTYAMGILIGAYLGDGTNAHGTNNQLIFSLNAEKWGILAPYFNSAREAFNEAHQFTQSPPKNKCVMVRLTSSVMKEFIAKWVSSSVAEEKRLNLECLIQSIEFRQGIIEGTYLTDGGNSNRIYSTSGGMIDDLEAVATSLGMLTVRDISDRTDEPVVIRGAAYKRNFPLHCLRWYNRKHRTSYEGLYKVKQNSVFFKIRSIEEITDYPSNFVYCFQMDAEDNPYFTLPNGIITHNCRLLSDRDMLDLGNTVNSFGGTSISLGSHRVATIDYNRIALETASYEDYLKLLDERIISSAKILKAHKELISDGVKNGLHPFISNGYISMNRMFSTFGVIGIVEAAEILRDKYSVIDGIGETLTHLNQRVKELSKEYGITGNIEQIPGESMAVKLADVDRLFYGKEKVSDKLYANQFIPLWQEASVWERMDIDGTYNKKFSGGGIAHISIGEKVTASQAYKLIMYACKSGCEHFALNSVYSKCSEGHTTFGNSTKCPECGADIVEKFTRVVGFFVPVSSMNKTRREWEFPRRVFGAIDSN